MSRDSLPGCACSADASGVAARRGQERINLLEQLVSKLELQTALFSAAFRHTAPALFSAALRHTAPRRCGTCRPDRKDPASPCSRRSITRARACRGTEARDRLALCPADRVALDDAASECKELVATLARAGAPRSAPPGNSPQPQAMAISTRPAPAAIPTVHFGIREAGAAGGRAGRPSGALTLDTAMAREGERGQAVSPARGLLRSPSPFSGERSPGKSVLKADTSALRPRGAREEMRRVVFAPGVGEPLRDDSAERRALHDTVSL